jgi:hypothetical protein
MRGIKEAIAYWLLGGKPQEKKGSYSELMREATAGFDMKSLHDTRELEEIYDDEEALEAFLARVRDLDANPALDAILNVIKRNQMLHTALNAKSLDEVNFGRATINGLQLFREEVDRLVGIYRSRHTHEGEFDRSEVV